jgi:hypothetical protein
MLSWGFVCVAFVKSSDGKFYVFAEISGIKMRKTFGRYICLMY